MPQGALEEPTMIIVRYKNKGALKAFLDTKERELTFQILFPPSVGAVPKP